ncbi:MAG: hypothetical protein OEW39_12090, partial [Deltaproteobacteria bacterium]|nr:hypothetical protein [Deltaproteobacteria bacterium]
SLDAGTRTYGYRFGKAPVGSATGDGVSVAITADIQGTVYYTVGQPTCSSADTVYSDAARPALVPTTPGVDQSWMVCFQGFNNNLYETLHIVTVYYDATPPTPQLVDAQGNVLNPQPGTNSLSYTSFPQFSVRFQSTAPAPEEDGIIAYTVNPAGTPVVLNSDGTTTNSKVAVTASVGGFMGTPFTHVGRSVAIQAVDAVGNLSAVSTYTIPLDVVGVGLWNGSTTLAFGNGLFKLPNQTLILKDTSPVQVFAGFSKAWMLLCGFSESWAYGCDNTGTLKTTPTLTPGSERVINTVSDYLQTITTTTSGVTESTVFLAGNANGTALYDYKYIFQSDTVPDLERQVISVIDQDFPEVLIVRDPTASTGNTLAVKALVYDPGFYTVAKARVTNYGINRAALTNCQALGACFGVNLPIAVVPGPMLLPADNSVVQVDVSATDAVGNPAKASATTQLRQYLPVGRTLANGTGADAAIPNLGGAMVKGNFDGNGSPDFAIAEPSLDTVYLFHDSLRTAIASKGTAGLGTVDIATNPSLTVTVSFNGGATTTSGTLDINTAVPYVATPATASIVQIVDALNAEMMRLRKAGTELGLYFSAEDTDGNSDKDQVVLRSYQGSMEHCATVSVGGLQTALGLTANPVCVYDQKLSGTLGTWFGAALTTGDFDGDGRDDLAIGAPKAAGAVAGSGAVFVHYATAGATAIPYVNAAADVTFSGGLAGDDFGWSLAAGKFDRAWLATPAKTTVDLVIGAPGRTNSVGPYAESGGFYLYRTPFPASPATVLVAGATIATQYDYNVPTQRFGHALLAGDLNADGLDELVVGAPGVSSLGQTAGIDPLYNTAYKGSVHFYSLQLNNSLPVAPGSQIGNIPDSKFGWSLGWAGTLFNTLLTPTGSVSMCQTNNACVAVGAPHDETTGTATDNHGIVYLGNRDTFANTPSNLVKIAGKNPKDQLGISFAYGDLNGDSLGDLVVGQEGGSSLSPIGAVIFRSYGGINILKGASTTTFTPAFSKQFPALDVDSVTNNKMETKFGWRILAVDSTPNDAQQRIDTLIIGAPGGTPDSGSAAVGGRLHVWGRNTFFGF